MSGRTKMVGAVFLVFGIFWWPTVGTAGPVTVWSDEFEAGLGSEWTSSSSNFSVIASSLAFEGSRYLNIIGPSAIGGDTLLLAVSSVGYENLQFTGKWKIHDRLESVDHLAFEFSPDGVNWQSLITLSDLPAGEWSSFSADLPPGADNNPNLAFRWREEFSGQTDRVLGDNFGLFGTPIPEPATLAMLGLGSCAGIWGFRRRFS